MKIAVLDLETDPFQYGRVPRPFVCGFFDGARFLTWWGDDCIQQSFDFLASEPEPWVIYAHNGGKFDWFYYLDLLTDRSSLRIVNGRIIQGYLGKHEIRDSYAIMPFPLDAYRKDEIDYTKLERCRRNRHKLEILSYLRGDCVYLHELLVKYYEEFGDVLTVGSAALRELKTRERNGSEPVFTTPAAVFHKDSNLWTCQYDQFFREHFYHGGRVEVFSKERIVRRPVQVIDVNSMYPYVMAEYLHPVSVGHSIGTTIEDDTCFLTVKGYSAGAFAVRTKNGISFPHGNGTFHTTIHEWNAAIETGCFRPAKIIATYSFLRRANFSKFVYHFYDSRRRAAEANDECRKLFFKFILNSCYGKFAQNPLNYYEYEITGIVDREPPWEIDAHNFACDRPYMVWKKPISRPVYHNIATAASITGAARAVLLRGIHAVDSPLYCDTDSIIAHSCGVLKTDNERLGGWKLETSGSSAIFAGKKIYAVFDAAGEIVKAAHKGFRPCECKAKKGKPHGPHCQAAKNLRDIAEGKTFAYHSPAPHFGLSGSTGFVSRVIRATV